MIERLARILRALGANGVPIGGVYGAGWSVGTGLALYWIENLMLIPVLAIVILVHRHLTHKRGHWMGKVTITRGEGARSTTTTRPGTLLQQYLATMIPFTLVHGVFVTMLVFVALPNLGGEAARLDWRALGQGSLGLAGVLGVGLVWDLIGISKRPFSWVESLVAHATGRMVIVHLTILFGMFALMLFHQPMGLFFVFAGLKALMDLAAIWPKSEASAEPPAWLQKTAGKLGKGRDADFVHRYEEDLRQAKVAAEEKEQVLSAPPSL